MGTDGRFKEQTAILGNGARAPGPCEAGVCPIIQFPAWQGTHATQVAPNGSSPRMRSFRNRTLLRSTVALLSFLSKRVISSRTQSRFSIRAQHSMPLAEASTMYRPCLSFVAIHRLPTIGCPSLVGNEWWATNRRTWAKRSSSPRRPCHSRRFWHDGTPWSCRGTRIRPHNTRRIKTWICTS